MDGEGEKWKERALRLARIFDAYLDEPSDDRGCWSCGAWFEDGGNADHAPDCQSAETNALIEEIKAAARDRFDPAG